MVKVVRCAWLGTAAASATMENRAAERVRLLRDDPTKLVVLFLIAFFITASWIFWRSLIGAH
jgi:hypothetical protein